MRVKQQEQIITVNVNYVSKVVTVMLPWVLLLVLFVPLVGHLILEVLNVVNAKLEDLTVKKENLVQIVQKVGIVIVLWLLQSVVNVELVKIQVKVVLDGKHLLLFL